MDFKHQIANAVADNVDGQGDSMIARSSYRAESSASLRVEECADAKPHKLQADSSVISGGLCSNLDCATAEDLAKSSTSFEHDCARGSAEEASMRQADHLIMSTIATQKEPILHRKRSDEYRFGVLPVPTLNPELLDAKLMPKSKSWMHLQKGALKTKLAKLGEERETWNDEEMQRTFEMIINFDVVKDLIQNEEELRGRIQAEIEEEQGKHVLSPPLEFTNGKDLALEFQYLRWQSHVGILDIPIITAEDVDRLRTTKFIDLASFDFPLGLALLAKGALERHLTKKLFPDDARSIPSSTRWTISSDARPPTLGEIGEYIQKKEEWRCDSPKAAETKYILPEWARPMISTSWLEKCEEENGVYGLKTFGYSDEKLAAIIMERDITFFSSDDEKSYVTGPRLYHEAVGGSETAAEPGLAPVDDAPTEEVPAEDTTTPPGSPNFLTLAFAENDTPAAANDTPVAAGDEASTAGSPPADTLHGQSSDEGPSKQERESGEAVSNQEADAPSVSADADVASPPATDVEQEELIPHQVAAEKDVQPSVLRRSNRLQEKISTKKTTDSPLKETQLCANEPMSSASHARAISSAEGHNRQSISSASAIKITNDRSSTRKSTNTTEGAPKEGSKKAAPERRKRKRTEDEEDAPEQGAKGRKRQRKLGKSVGETAAMTADESIAEPEPKQERRRSQRKRKVKRS